MSEDQVAQRRTGRETDLVDEQARSAVVRFGPGSRGYDAEDEQRRHPLPFGVSMKPFRRVLIVLVPLLAAGLIASANPAAATTSATTSARPSPADITWMVAAHQSNLAEIAAGHAAERRAATWKVRHLGAMFARMHSELDAALKAKARTLGVDLPSAPTPAQQAQLAAVKAHHGRSFDRAWVRQQIAAHVKTLVATLKELKVGRSPVVLHLARTTKPVVVMHLRELLRTAFSWCHHHHHHQAASARVRSAA
jgi:putative membrane protein